MSEALSLRCLCGAVCVELHGKPAARANCHCETCRDFYATPMLAATAWQANAVCVRDGTVRVFAHPTRQMTRTFCPTCGDTLYGTNRLGMKVVPNSLVARANAGRLPEAFQPTMHLFYRQRIVDVDDGLTKYLDGWERPIDALASNGAVVAADAPSVQPTSAHAKTLAAGSVSLRPITLENFEALMDMELPPEQARFLASNAYSIAQSHYYADYRPRGIYLDDTPVGFALYDVTGNDEPGHYAIYRLMVDHPQQNRGIGRRAMALLLTEIRSCPDARRITICYKPDNATARGFYASLGFIEAGIDELGEMVAEILIGTPDTEPS